VSDTHQDEVVDVHEDDYERERREARERAYQDVSLRAVELLANAQRAADEAVAEAQSYARDLEETARDQYRVILQRANEAARATAGAQPEPDPDPEPDAVGGQDAGLPRAAVTAPPSAAEAQQLEYVRTYARVAHSQLRAVLGALNDELDKLADLAQPDGGPASGAPIEVSEPPPEPSAAEVDEPGESPEPGADTGLDGHAVHPHDGHHQG
jgi:cell division septum initiation protein DivIVA